MCERYYINTELRILSRNINNYFINYGNRKKVDKMTLIGKMTEKYHAMEKWVKAPVAVEGVRREPTKI